MASTTEMLSELALGQHIQRQFALDPVRQCSGAHTELRLVHADTEIHPAEILDSTMPRRLTRLTLSPFTLHKSKQSTHTGVSVTAPLQARPLIRALPPLASARTCQALLTTWAHRPAHTHPNRSLRVHTRRRNDTGEGSGSKS